MSAKTELRKALTTSGAPALNPYDLDPVLNEELMKLQPLSQLIDMIQAEAKTHEYTVRSSHPFAWFEGEATPANAKNSTYLRKNVQVKIQRIWGSVTGFVQAMDERFINALSAELEGSLEGCANLQEFGTLWGTADDIGFTGDPYQYSGIFPRLFKFAPGNVIDAGGAKLTLDMLDQAHAKSASFRGVQGDPRLWLMGFRMKQVADGLQTKVQLPLSSMTLADGQLRMAAYANAPIYETDYLVPGSTSTSPSDMAGASAAGGSLTAGTTYHYKISSITQYGEQISSADVAAATDAGEGTIELDWTADPDALSYMIFRGSANNNQVLIDIIPALTYDAAGTVNGVVETYADKGEKTPTTIKPLLTGEQNILLANLNPRRGVAYVGKVDDMGRPVDNLWSFIETARVKDSFDYFLKCYMTERIVYPNLMSVVRHVKLS